MSAYSLIINLFSVASWMKLVQGQDMKPFIISVVAIMLIASAASLPFVLNAGFGQAPQGVEKSQIERSPNYRDGAFQNALPTPGFTPDAASADGANRSRQPAAGAGHHDLARPLLVVPAAVRQTYFD